MDVALGFGVSLSDIQTNAGLGISQSQCNNKSLGDPNGGNHMLEYDEDCLPARLAFDSCCAQIAYRDDYLRLPFKLTALLHVISSGTSVRNDLLSQADSTPVQLTW